MSKWTHNWVDLNFECNRFVESNSRQQNRNWLRCEVRLRESFFGVEIYSIEFKFDSREIPSVIPSNQSSIRSAEHTAFKTPKQSLYKRLFLLKTIFSNQTHEKYTLQHRSTCPPPATLLIHQCETAPRKTSSHQDRKLQAAALANRPRAAQIHTEHWLNLHQPRRRAKRRRIHAAAAAGRHTPLVRPTCATTPPRNSSERTLQCIPGLYVHLSYMCVRALQRARRKAASLALRGGCGEAIFRADLWCFFPCPTTRCGVDREWEALGAVVVWGLEGVLRGSTVVCGFWWLGYCGRVTVT